MINLGSGVFKNSKKWGVLKPTLGWVEDLQGGDVVYLVKEKTLAKILCPMSEGRICLDFGVGRQEWSVNSDGTGMNGKPLMEPYFQAMRVSRSVNKLYSATDAITFPISDDEGWRDVVRLLMDDMFEKVDVHGFDVGEEIWKAQGVSIKSRSGNPVLSHLSLEKTNEGIRLFLNVFSPKWSRRFDVTRMITTNNWQFVIDVQGYGKVILDIEERSRYGSLAIIPNPCGEIHMASGKCKLEDWPPF